jgi:Tfp pilus assembly protein PilN
MSFAGQSRIYEQINFVPEPYRRARRRRSQAQRVAILGVVMIGAMVTLYVLTDRQADGLADYSDTLKQQIAAAQGQLIEVSKLQKVRGELGRQARIYNELARPITFTVINSALAAATPESIVLSEYSAEIQSLERARVRDASNPRNRDRPRTVTEGYEVIAIELQGVAPSNVDIANYVGRLASTSVFRNVKMLHAKQGRIDDSIIRQFRITMEVPLDRDYRLAAPQELANAS